MYPYYYKSRLEKFSLNQHNKDVKHIRTIFLRNKTWISIRPVEHYSCLLYFRWPIVYCCHHRTIPREDVVLLPPGHPNGPEGSASTDEACDILPAELPCSVCCIRWVPPTQGQWSLFPWIQGSPGTLQAATTAAPPSEGMRPGPAWYVTAGTHYQQGGLPAQENHFPSHSPPLL